jgi:hypothetical protein
MHMQQGRNEHEPGVEQVGLHQAYVLSPRRQRQRQDLMKKFVGVMAVVEK